MLRTPTTRRAFMNLRRNDTRLYFKGRVYYVKVCNVLTYGCETWIRRVDDGRWLSAFNQRSTTRWWGRWVGSYEARPRVLDTDDRFMTEIVALYHRQWLGQVLCMPGHRFFAHRAVGLKV